VGAAIALVGCTAWFFLSRPQAEPTADCGPQGRGDAVRARMQGARFWRAELGIAERSIVRDEGWPVQERKAEGVGDSVLASLNEMVRPWRAHLDSFYAKYPGSRPSTRDSMAAALRDRADSIDHAELTSTIDSLTALHLAALRHCLPTLRQRAQ
jgi:hypothetical protein